MTDDLSCQQPQVAGLMAEQGVALPSGTDYSELPGRVLGGKGAGQGAIVDR